MKKVEHFMKEKYTNFTYITPKILLKSQLTNDQSDDDTKSIAYRANINNKYNKYRYQIFLLFINSKSNILQLKHSNACYKCITISILGTNSEKSTCFSSGYQFKPKQTKDYVHFSKSV